MNNTQIPANSIDQACDTPEFATALENETKDLLCRDRILELMDTDINLEKLLLIYAGADNAHRAYSIDRYILGKAADLAYKTVKHEFEGML